MCWRPTGDTSQAVQPRGISSISSELFFSRLPPARCRTLSGDLRLTMRFFFSTLAVAVWIFLVHLDREMSGNLETRSYMNELRSFQKRGFFDFGHPLLNCIAESFVKAAAVGAVQAVSRHAYCTALEAGQRGAGAEQIQAADVTGRRRRVPGLGGSTSQASLEALVKNTGKEAIRWGMAAGIYSGLTYSLREARGAHDWKDSAFAGAITGAALALTSEDTSQEQIVQCAITGAAISAAANLLVGIF